MVGEDDDRVVDVPDVVEDRRHLGYREQVTDPGELLEEHLGRRDFQSCLGQRLQPELLFVVGAVEHDHLALLRRELVQHVGLQATHEDGAAELLLELGQVRCAAEVPAPSAFLGVGVTLGRSYFSYA